jgi:DNA-binding transcriptional MerR regulator
MFRIGDFAQFTRVSVTMLRHYDEVGLLRPARVDEAGGHRYYSADQLPRLNRILLLRELGFGLDEVATMLDTEEPAELDEVFAHHERTLADTLARTQARLRAVRARRALLAEGQPPADVVVRSVGSLFVATLTGAADEEDVGALFHALETYVRDRRARAGRPPLRLLPEPDDRTVTVAVPLTRPVDPQGRIEVGFLDPVPRMACVVHRGGYAGLAGLLQRMLCWLERTGEQPGRPIREAYLRFGAEPELGLPPAYLADERANLVIELQVPLTGGA